MDSEKLGWRGGETAMKTRQMEMASCKNVIQRADFGYKQLSGILSDIVSLNQTQSDSIRLVSLNKSMRY